MSRIIKITGTNRIHWCTPANLRPQKHKTSTNPQANQERPTDTKISTPSNVLEKIPKPVHNASAYAFRGLYHVPLGYPPPLICPGCVSFGRFQLFLADAASFWVFRMWQVLHNHCRLSWLCVPPFARFFLWSSSRLAVAPHCVHFMGRCFCAHVLACFCCVRLRCVCHTIYVCAPHAMNEYVVSVCSSTCSELCMHSTVGSFSPSLSTGLPVLRLSRGTSQLPSSLRVFGLRF